MHEAGVAERILELVLARARDAGATRIVRVHLEPGPGEPVSLGALHLHWAEAARGTPAEGAALAIAGRDLPDGAVASGIQEDDEGRTGLQLVGVDVDGLPAS
jgi:hypothetical protein